jgi:hypothetical protein
MNFFTRQWLSGQLPDTEYEKVVPSYWEHIKRLDLPVEIQQLVELNTHDGIILEAIHDADHEEFILKLRCGDRYAGYFDAELSFSKVAISQEDLTTLNEVGKANNIELIYDEVDRSELGCLEYRLLFSNLVEAKFMFEQVSISVNPVADRDSP